MQVAEFFDLVDDYFGPRAINKGFAQSTTEFTATLYETFRLTCSLGGEHGEFGAGIETASGRYLGTFFNERLSLNSDPESILKSLGIIDEWCRLHLPDKFLERYEAALGVIPS